MPQKPQPDNPANMATPGEAPAGAAGRPPAKTRGNGAIRGSKPPGLLGRVFGEGGDGGGGDENDRRDYRDLVKINQAVLPLLLLGLFAAALLGLLEGTFAAVVLWCVACLSVGGLLGFLFGIPRAMTSGEEAAAGKDEPAPSTAQGKRSFLRANTNLEEVSDWLTKIIVGLSLVHLKDIEARLHAVSKLAAASIVQPQVTGPAGKAVEVAQAGASAASGQATALVIQGAASSGASATTAAQGAASATMAGCSPLCALPEAAVSMAMALIVSMTVLGFLLSYLYTRLFLPAAFRRSERDAADMFMDRLSQAQGNATQAPALPLDTPVAASATDVLAAKRVAEAVPAERPDLPLRELSKLAAEYDQLRVAMPSPSNLRTSQMMAIVSRMKPLTLASRSGLAELMNSPLPGERLAATVILLMYFDPQHIDWLAQRLPQESAFIGFQAASALLARMRVADEAERQRIVTSVTAARGSMTTVDGPRDKLVERIVSNTAPT